jgi:tRNA (guanine-N7-)-methyltransferase
LTIRPYADAPRLPEGERIAIVDLVSAPSGEYEIEIGPGPKAGFLLERALAAPQAGLLGLEIRRKWASVGDARLAKHGHRARARVFCEDARLALARLGPDASVSRVFFHFPDPWWKKRHQKRLVVGDVVLDHVARLLRPKGHLFIQTDVEERADLYEMVVGGHGAFVPVGDTARIEENPFGARSPREHRAIADGLPVYRMLFERK